MYNGDTTVLHNGKKIVLYDGDTTIFGNLHTIVRYNGIFDRET